MATRTPSNLRPIAEDQLVDCFGRLETETKNDLATSLVRQWLTHDGAAVLLTTGQECRFRLRRLPDDKTQVVRDVLPGTFPHRLRRNRVVPEQIPGLLHALNLRQCVLCATDSGEVLKLRVDPCTMRFFIEPGREGEP